MKVTVINPIMPYNSASYEAISLVHAEGNETMIITENKIDSETGNYITHTFPDAFLYMIET